MLSVGGGDITGAVAGMEDVNVEDERRRNTQVTSVVGKRKRGQVQKGSKKWIMKKKEQMRGKGKIVKADSKYSGRKRGIKF